MTRICLPTPPLQSHISKAMSRETLPQISNCSTPCNQTNGSKDISISSGRSRQLPISMTLLSHTRFREPCYLSLPKKLHDGDHDEVKVVRRGSGGYSCRHLRRNHELTHRIRGISGSKQRIYWRKTAKTRSEGRVSVNPHAFIKAGLLIIPVGTYCLS